MKNTDFDSKRIAQGYAKRPWLHKEVIEQVKADYEITQNFENGLDVGCGAGLSTKALQRICNYVTGTDISPEMIDICKQLYKNDTYDFYVAKAEETKLPSKPYDIVTAAGVINWVDREKFLHNAAQIMAQNGIIIIYDFWITDKMIENQDYTEWYQNQYLKEFTKPPRNEDTWTQSDLGEDFLMEKQTSYEMTYPFSLEEFVDFMMIQSNVNAKIEKGIMSEAEVRVWMNNTLLPIFKNQKEKLVFAGYNWYIRKNKAL